MISLSACLTIEGGDGTFFFLFFEIYDYEIFGNNIEGHGHGCSIFFKKLISS